MSAKTALPLVLAKRPRLRSPSDQHAQQSSPRSTDSCTRARAACTIASRGGNVSARGPFALAYPTGPQEAAILLRCTGTRWTSLGAISDEGSPAASVIAYLQLEKYNDGPKPCTRRRSAATR